MVKIKVDVIVLLGLLVVELTLGIPFFDDIATVKNSNVSAKNQLIEDKDLAKPMKLIGRHIPTYASEGNAGFANDRDWGSFWKGSVPGWLAFDLSGIPTKDRQQLVFVWFNDPLTSIYDHSVYKTRMTASVLII